MNLVSKTKKEKKGGSHTQGGYTNTTKFSKKKGTKKSLANSGQQKKCPLVILVLLTGLVKKNEEKNV